MSAPRAFRVKSMNGAALERFDRGFDKARFVERIGMNCDLHVHLVGNRKTGIDGRRRRAPILVQLQSDRAVTHLLAQRLPQAGVALAEKTEVHRECLGCLEHLKDVPRPRRASRRKGSRGRAGATADHGRDARHQRFLD